ncbi:MAG TPA: amidohydrolase family protein [Candidatus Dormibacteraeota bacterium]|nr:amidohydrolase family protein [Candidatus Dormibacteraeota bacterium]
MLTLLRDLNLIDGSQDGTRAHVDVLIEGSQIVAIGSTGQPLASSDDIRVLEGMGRWAVPGLVDAHIHLCIPYHPDDPGGDLPGTSQESVALAAIYGLWNARSLIGKGITTVRDVGSHGHGIFAVKRLIDSDQAVGPRIIPSGRAIAMTGGHGAMLAVFADGPDGVRKAAREELAAGALSLKLMATGSGASAKERPTDVHYTVAELAAGAEAAHGLGRPVAVHATNATGVKNAISAGADSIEHGIVMDDDALALMSERHTFYVPTVWAYHYVGERARHLATPAHVAEEVQSRYQAHHENVRRAQAAGIRIVAGTDAAMPINPPESLLWELEWLVACGLTPHQAIVSATSHAAALLRISDQVGMLLPGQAADILVVGGDPLTDIRNLGDTQIVMRGGRVHVLDGLASSGPFISDDRPVPPGPWPNNADQPELRSVSTTMEGTGEMTI